MIPDPESLNAQFSQRSTFIITDDDDDRLSATYWLATPMLEESDQELENVRKNFTYLHNYLIIC